MSRDEAIQLARDIALRGDTIRAYCQRQEVPASTVTSRAYRAGVRLGVEVRRWRVARVEALKLAHPTRPVSQLALEVGFSAAQHYYRARRSLARWEAA